MKNYTLSVSAEQLIKLKQFYQNFLIKVDQPYLEFVAIHNEVRVSAFTTGKVLLQGEEINAELVTIKRLLNIKNFSAIGSDEVGTGDVFGPVVVCACYVSEDDIPFLEDLNVRDSKNMKTRDIIRLAPIIAKKLTHSLVILSPIKYNSTVEEGFNMNKIKAFLHNHMIIKTTAKVNEMVPVIVDQFCQPNHYFNYLKDEKLVYRDVEFHPKAESIHVSVAAASIIARYAFLVKMHQYSKQYGLKLKLGAGKEVDEQIKQIHAHQGLKGLSKIAKMNFKNVTKLNLV